MLKRLVILSLFFIFPCAFAGGPEVPVGGYFDGFYVGAGAGAAYVSFKHRASGVVPAAAPGTFEDGTTTKLLGIGSLYLGYGQEIGQFYLGLKFDVTFNKTSMGFDTAEADPPLANARLITMTMNLSDSVALMLKGGYLLTPMTLFYLQMGGAYLSSAGFNAVSKDTNAGAISLFNSKSRKLFGYRAGIGIEQGICDHLSVLLAYSYTYYPWLSQTTANTGAVFVSNIRVRPYINQVVLGLTYYFKM